MIRVGSTITLEAWDMKYKPNQDWNHAWGAAPANLLPRHILGVQPATAGWAAATIRPCPGTLEFARGKVPTPLGPVEIDWKKDPSFQLSLKLPTGMTATVEVPATDDSTGVWVNGKQVSATRVSSGWALTETVAGTVNIEVQ